MKALRPVNLLLALMILLVALAAHLFLPISSSSVSTVAIPSSEFPRSSIVVPGNGAWDFIVPNRYIGDLAIAFGCPGGHPLNMQHGVITTRFPATGPDCVNDTIPPEVDPSQIHAAWANGTILPTLPIGGSIIAGQTVFAYREGMGQGNPNKPNTFFNLYYVGPSDCAKRSFSLQPGAHLPARCHYEDPYALTVKYSGIYAHALTVKYSGVYAHGQ